MIDNNTEGCFVLYIGLYMSSVTVIRKWCETEGTVGSVYTEFARI
jgi:hypothetical protein